jgi:hypothetical protein
MSEKARILADMSDEISFEGKQYISSKRAAQLSGYAQDYIGQLARKGLIEARRVGGLWYILLESLNAYKEKAEGYTPQPPTREIASAPESVISFDGKQYLSASKAAQNTGYHQDYIGQLARAGKIPSRQIGNRWYVDHESLVAHKDEKDGLLAAVQSESVGLAAIKTPEPEESTSFFTYTQEKEQDLMPRMQEQQDKSDDSDEGSTQEEVKAERVPIRIVNMPKPTLEAKLHSEKNVAVVSRSPKKASRRSFGLIGAAALTIVIVLSVGFISLKSGSFYALGNKLGETAATGSVHQTLQGIADWLESFFAQQPQYHK